MKLFNYGKDGGPDSKVWGFWLIEWKKVFSIALLKFVGDSREVYHTHAFHSVSWLLWGRLKETRPLWNQYNLTINYKAGLKPIFTSRFNLHKVSSTGTSWALTFRGPWSDQWMEVDPVTKQMLFLTHGRKPVETPNN